MLADDHHLFRQVVARHLGETCERIYIVGDAANGQMLLDMMENNTPDIVLLDLEMPVLDGHKTLLKIRERFPLVRTIILSTHYNEFYVAQLLILGASGYLSKTCLAEDLVRTIEMVHQHGFYFNERISKEVLVSLLDDKKLEYLISDRILSDREVQVLKLICNGKIYKEVADQLHISLDTVKFHIKSIYKKTQINSIAGLVKYAIKVGITTLAE